MPLNPEELDFIRQFVKSKGYTSLEVKQEMVDHLACVAEESREAGSEESMPSIISKYHASFGIFGFSDWEQGIIKQAQRKVYRQLGAIAAEVLRSKEMVYVLFAFALAWMIGTYLISFTQLTNTYRMSYWLVYGGFLFVWFGKYRTFKKALHLPALATESLTIQVVAGFFIVMQLMADGMGTLTGYLAISGHVLAIPVYAFGMAWLTFGFLVWLRSLAWSSKFIQPYLQAPA